MCFQLMPDLIRCTVVTFAWQQAARESDCSSKIPGNRHETANSWITQQPAWINTDINGRDSASED